MRPIVPSSLGRPKSLLAFLAVGSLALTFPTIAQEVQDVYPHTTVWVPESQAEHTIPQDDLFNWILWLTCIINLLVFAVMGYFMVRYRSRPGQKTKFIHGNNKLEAVWTLIPTLIMALIAVFSASTWAEMKYPQTDEKINKEVAAGEAIKINVFGRQFAWIVQYPGPDGKLGKINPSKYTRTGTFGEMIGLDRSGDGKDDVVIDELIVPVNMTTHLRLQSLDVLHSFFLPTLRIKQDAVPGLSGKIWFRPTKLNVDMHGTLKEGDEKLGYARDLDLICAELCGAGHYTMRAPFYVVTHKQYLDYINSQSPVNADSEDEDEDEDF